MKNYKVRYIFYNKPVQVLFSDMFRETEKKKIKNLIIIFRNHEGCSVKRDTDTVDGK